MASFERLRQMCDGKTVEKKRYGLPADHALVEVDVYGGALERLVTAEVEFPSEEEADAHTPLHGRTGGHR